MMGDEWKKERRNVKCKNNHRVRSIDFSPSFSLGYCKWGRGGGRSGTYQ